MKKSRRRAHHPHAAHGFVAFSTYCENPLPQPWPSLHAVFCFGKYGVRSLYDS